MHISNNLSSYILTLLARATLLEIQNVRHKPQTPILGNPLLSGNNHTKHVEILLYTVLTGGLHWLGHTCMSTTPPQVF